MNSPARPSTPAPLVHVSRGGIDIGHLHFPPVEWHERVGARTIAYVAVVSVRQWALGMAMIVNPSLFTQARRYDVIFHVMPRTAWGIAFLILAAICIWAIRSRTWLSVSLALGLSAMLATMWGVAMLLGKFTNTLVGPTEPIVWLFLAAKDLLRIGQMDTANEEQVLNRIRRHKVAHIHDPTVDPDVVLDVISRPDRTDRPERRTATKPRRRSG